jgi:hypothetical protein
MNLIVLTGIVMLMGCGSQRANTLVSLEEACKSCDSLDATFEYGGEKEVPPLHIENSEAIASVLQKIQLHSAREVRLDGKLAAKPAVRVRVMHKDKELAQFDLLGDFLFVDDRGQERCFQLSNFDAYQHFLDLSDE